jgi:hypothetical protein
VPHFRVQLYNSGQWDGQPSFEVLADDPQSAAEYVANEELARHGSVENFRASVWEADQPHIKGLYFYRIPARLFD